MEHFLLRPFRWLTEGLMYVQGLTHNTLMCIQVLMQDWRVQELQFPESVKTKIIFFLYFNPLEVNNLAAWPQSLILFLHTIPHPPFSFSTLLPDLFPQRAAFMGHIMGSLASGRFHTWRELAGDQRVGGEWDGGFYFPASSLLSHRWIRGCIPLKALVLAGPCLHLQLSLLVSVTSPSPCLFRQGSPLLPAPGCFTIPCWFSLTLL